MQATQLAPLRLAPGGRVASGQPDEDLQADHTPVIIHSPRIPPAGQATAPSFRRAQSARAREGAPALAQPRLCERLGRARCQVALSLATGVFFGWATGMFVMVGLALDGEEPETALFWGLTSGAATLATTTCLAWRLVEGIDEALQDATRADTE